MIIDFFCHIYPRDYVKAAVRHRVPPNWRFLEAVQSESSLSGFCDPEPRLRLMDKYGIDRQVLCLGNPFLEYFGNSAAELSRVANNAIAAIVDRYPDRFSGVACLPLTQMDQALAELERAINVLGFKGVLLTSHVNGVPLDSEELWPLFERVAREDIFVLLHPADVPSHNGQYEQALMIAVAWPFDTSLALCRLVMGGILDRLPNLKIIAHHAGAMIPFFAGRFASQDERNRRLPKPVLEYFRQLYGDTAVDGWGPALTCAHAFLGANHLVFATDYPFGPEGGEPFIQRNLEAVKAMAIPPEEREKILGLNALQLLRLSR